MDIQAIHSILLERFGEAVVGSQPHKAIDPWIQVEPASIREVCEFLRDDSRFRFNHLHDLCGVDYLEPDPKKAAKKAEKKVEKKAEKKAAEKPAPKKKTAKTAAEPKRRRKAAAG